MNPTVHSVEAMPRVLIVDLAKYYGGADVRVIELARSLAQRGIYFAVAALAGSPLHLQLKKEELSVLPVPFSRGNPLVVPFLMRAIQRHKFTVVDAHNSQSQFWAWTAAQLSPGVRMISTAHSAYRVEHNGSMKGLLYEQVLRLNALRKTRFIAVSEAVEGYLHNIGIAEEKVSLIHNSTRLPETVNRDHRAAVLSSLGWDENSFVVIVVGRLEPVKGHAVLLNALKTVAPQFPQMRCLIVGEGRMRESLAAQARRLQLEAKVHFTGFRDDVSSLLAVSDAFCMPSLSEGLPYALLEAVSYRLPLLVSNVGGMAALLSDHKNAILVPPSDAAQLSAGLVWMMQNRQEAARLGEAAFDLVQARFSCDQMISETIEMYQRPFSGRSVPLPLATKVEAEVWKA